MARHQHYRLPRRRVESPTGASDLRAAITGSLIVPRDEAAQPLVERVR